MIHQRLKIIKDFKHEIEARACYTWNEYKGALVSTEAQTTKVPNIFSFPFFCC